MPTRLESSTARGDWKGVEWGGGGLMESMATFEWKCPHGRKFSGPTSSPFSDARRRRRCGRRCRRASIPLNLAWLIIDSILGKKKEMILFRFHSMVWVLLIID